jgi:hypothetical protein
LYNRDKYFQHHETLLAARSLEQSTATSRVRAMAQEKEFLEKLTISLQASGYLGGMSNQQLKKIHNMTHDLDKST